MWMKSIRRGNAPPFGSCAKAAGTSARTARRERTNRIVNPRSLSGARRAGVQVVDGLRQHTFQLCGLGCVRLSGEVRDEVDEPVRLEADFEVRQEAAGDAAD